MTAKRALCLSIAWLLGSGASAVGASSPESSKTPDGRVLQPVENRQGLLISVHDRRVDVELPGGSRTVSRLRDGEVLTTAAETRGGWIAAGGRQRDPGVELVILDGGAGGVRRLPSPGSGAPFELRPTLLVAGGRLAGAAWLEGADARKLSVRAAAWNGAAWETPVTVAGPAAGSQTGLSGAVLDDGSWLLVWAAYDGADDELMWSRNRGSRWSPPRPLHAPNDTPDVTPALIAEGGTALVAWSRLVEGEYSLLLSRLEEDGWSEPRPVGPPGSLFPSFTRPGVQPLLLFRTARTRGWAAYELAAGAPELLAATATADGSRPALVPDGAGALRFRWAAGDGETRVDWEPLR